MISNSEGGEQHETRAGCACNKPFIHLPCDCSIALSMMLRMSRPVTAASLTAEIHTLSGTAAAQDGTALAGKEKEDMAYERGVRGGGGGGGGRVTCFMAAQSRAGVCFTSDAGPVNVCLTSAAGAGPSLPSDHSNARL